MSQPNGNLSDEPVLGRIMDLLRAQKKTDKELIDHLGMANGVFTKWKYNNGKSYFKYINEIADFLGVSTGYLLNGDDDITSDSLTGKEAFLVQMYRKLDDDGRESIMDVMDRYVRAEESRS